MLLSEEEEGGNGTTGNDKGTGDCKTEKVECQDRKEWFQQKHGEGQGTVGEGRYRKQWVAEVWEVMPLWSPEWKSLQEKEDKEEEPYRSYTPPSQDLCHWVEIWYTQNKQGTQPGEGADALWGIKEEAKNIAQGV
ncbi:UNVERIFIED_CONTAM: hypothetical protein FKN15_028065 [Acipenser sinensis]